MVSLRLESNLRHSQSVFPIAEVQASATTLHILIFVVGHLLHFPLFYGYLRGDAVCTMGGLVVDCMIVEIAQPP